MTIGGRSLILMALLLALVSCVPSTGSRGGGVVKAPKQGCLDCHPEMATRFAGGRVHPPVAEKNCAACHLPHGMIGGIQLRANPPDLCFSCHQAQARERGEKAVHQPFAEGKCNRCHAAHNSEFAHLLTKMAPALCFSCHDREPFSRKYVHAPVANGCAGCHLAHGGGATATVGARGGLALPGVP